MVQIVLFYTEISILRIVIIACDIARLNYYWFFYSLLLLITYETFSVYVHVSKFQTITKYGGIASRFYCTSLRPDLGSRRRIFSKLQPRDSIFSVVTPKTQRRKWRRRWGRRRSWSWAIDWRWPIGNIWGFPDEQTPHGVQCPEYLHLSCNDKQSVQIYLGTYSI